LYYLSKPAFGPAFLFLSHDEKQKIRIALSFSVIPFAVIRVSLKVIDTFQLATYIAPELAVHLFQVFPVTVVPGNETGSRCVCRDSTSNYPGAAPATVNEFF